MQSRVPGMILDHLTANQQHVRRLALNDAACAEGYKCHSGGAETCEYTKPNDCDEHSACTWCFSRAAGGNCFTKEDARKLPEAVFQCDSAAQQLKTYTT